MQTALDVEIRTLHGCIPRSSASAPGTQLGLNSLQSRGTEDNTCLTYKIIQGLVNVKPPPGLLKIQQEVIILNSTRHTQELTPISTNFPLGHPTVKLPPH